LSQIFINVGKFLIIPKRSADRNKAREISDEMIDEGSEPKLTGILSSKT